MANEKHRGPDKDAVLVATAIEELPYVTRAYQLLVTRYYGMLYRYCYGYLRDRAEAEDACQIILLKVFTGLPGFQRQSSFKTWLLRIAMNTCYSQKQKLTRERERSRPLESNNLAVGEQDQDPASGAFGGDRFVNMIEDLPSRDRQLLNLRFVADLTLEEIADIMDLGVSATKMRYYRALEKLGQQREND